LGTWSSQWLFHLCSSKIPNTSFSSTTTSHQYIHSIAYPEDFSSFILTLPFLSSLDFKIYYCSVSLPIIFNSLILFPSVIQIL
jgi:hypothetical protein